MSDFYEDVAVGVPIDLGAHRFTREAIVAFARRYDPQSFHVDEEAARAGPFGRLSAAGWHTAAVWMKLYVAHRTGERAAMAARGETLSTPGPSPGFRNLQWLRPVLVDDEISFGYRVIAKRAMPRRGWGLVLREGTGHNQHGEPVYRFEGSALWQRRPRA